MVEIEIALILAAVGGVKIHVLAGQEGELLVWSNEGSASLDLSDGSEWASQSGRPWEPSDSFKLVYYRLASWF